MAILDIPRGVLLYVILGNTYQVSDYFPEYHVVRTAEQRREILDRIDKEATDLQAAIDAKDPNLAPHVADSLTYLDRKGTSNWFCESCPYRTDCSGYQEFFGPQSEPLDQSKLLERAVEHLKQKALVKGADSRIY